MSNHAGAAPVSNRFLTPGVLALACVALLGAAAALYRFATGLGAATNLSNQYPWGIWIAVDVASGVALAAGGFTTAALVHIFQRHRYEVIVRPALLTAMLGYTFVVLGLLADLGRYYNLWHPAWPTMWQGNSVLFEVGMCVMVYLNVLYLEFVPMLCERFMGRVHLPGPLGRLNIAVDWALRFSYKILNKVMFVFIIAGVVLSCMHQSSLGALMLVAPYKMNPLWYTPILPLLFLLSAIAVGLPMVVFESMWASWAFGRKPEMNALAPLGRLMALLLAVYGTAKIADLVIREAYVGLFSGDTAARLCLLEIVGGILLPLALLTNRRVLHSARLLFTAGALVVFGVLLNRINVFLVAYTPPFAATRYFPSLLEIIVTLGLVSALVIVYRAFVTIFPVLPASQEAEDQLACHDERIHEMMLRPNQAVRAARETLRSPNVLLGMTAALATLLLAIGAAAQETMPGTAQTVGECSSCHSSDNPGLSDLFKSPCRRSRTPSGPVADRSEEAPDVFILDQLSSIYVPVVFPHKLHASMESMADGCNVCHHHDAPGKTRACHECHNGTASAINLRQPGLKGAYHRQCLGCHREWSHDTDCVVCHAKRLPGKAPELTDPTDIIGRLHPNVAVPDKRVYETPEQEQGSKVTFLHKEHVQLFGKKCVDCHMKENCSNCHDTAVAQEKRVRQDPHQDCSKCHDTSGDCTYCHMQQESTGFDHERRSGFMLKPFHHGVACGKCHTAEHFRGLKRECGTCHAPDWFPEVFDHAKTGLTLDTAHADTSCNGCHPNGLGKPTDCSVCHDDNRKYPDKSPGPTAMAGKTSPRSSG